MQFVITSAVLILADLRFGHANPPGHLQAHLGVKVPKFPGLTMAQTTKASNTNHNEIRISEHNQDTIARLRFRVKNPRATA